MDMNQAFELLKKAGGATAARIVLQSIGGDALPARPGQRTRRQRVPAIRVWVAAWKLKRGVPVAKIIGKKWFYGMEFYTNKQTLDPRPDSETLVDTILNGIKSNSLGARLPPIGGGVSAELLSRADEGGYNEHCQSCKGYDTPPRILDLGTGTGCLICAVVKNLPGATGVGIDVSRGACRVANRNVKALGLADRIKITKGNFNKLSDFRFKISGKEKTGKLFDIIISNPPYIALGDTRVNRGALYDPALALYAGGDGLDAYRAIAKNACAVLACGGRIYLEIGSGQGAEVREIFTSKGWKFVASYKDLGGIERVLEFS